MTNSENRDPDSNSDQLPLSVWLKGDEPYFQDFSLDAEEVMEQLGIKRSRLRQISGNELRVGRKRVERYIRPFYRPEDVDKYLSWTRATASHQKSSQMLNTAAEKLSSQSKAVLEHMTSAEQKLLNQLEVNGDGINRSFKAAAIIQNQLISLLKQLHSTSLRAANAQHDFFNKTLLPRLEQSQNAWQEAHSNLSRLSSINEAFLESIGLIQSNHQVLLELQLKLEKFEAHQEGLGLSLEELRGELAEQTKQPVLRRHQPARKLIPRPHKEKTHHSRQPRQRYKRRLISKPH